MLRQGFQRELEHLQDEVLVLGSMVEKAVIESVDILKRRDLEASRRLIADDLLINEKRFAIEADILELIATQQPMASDLRILAAKFDMGMLCSQTLPGPLSVARKRPSPAKSTFFSPRTAAMS